MSDADREKWDARYRAEAPADRAPPRWVEAFDDVIPREGRALDVAAGTGRLARWAAERGLDVVAVDVSEVGLAKIGHPRVETMVRDLERDPTPPPGPFALITIFHYRQASLWPALREALAPRGILLAEQPTVVNLERHAHPSRRWLAEPGELEALAGGLEVVSYEEGWLDDRHTARLVARRPGAQ